MGIDRVEVDELDLADLGSVREFAQRFLASGRSAEIVINNAGIMACPETRLGPGWEAQFATNHLGHFTLVNLLWQAIAREGTRVVSVSSAGHRRSPMRWDDVMFERGYDKWEAYGQAKTANVLFAVHLDALGRDSGVRAFAVHPGGMSRAVLRGTRSFSMHDDSADGNRPAPPPSGKASGRPISSQPDVSKPSHPTASSA